MRDNPAAFGRALKLSRTHVAALRGVDRFFEKEQPITGRPGPLAAGPRLTTRGFGSVPAPATGITVSADSGTLLTGPVTGTYTIVSSATATNTPVTSIAPDPGSGAPGSPPGPEPGPAQGPMALL
jgi:hypothetical protein